MKKILLAATLLTLSVGSAQAATVNYTITGDVFMGDELGEINDFGLTGTLLGDPGETFTVTGTFDDSVLTSGGGTVSFGDGSGNTMTLSIGTETLFASDDIDFLSEGLPALTFSSYTSLTSAVLTDFDYFSGINSSELNYLSSFSTSFDDGEFMFGDWRADVTITAVPVPAAAWLFGSGLLGLVGLARRKTA